LDGMVLGHASAGPAMLMTRQGPRFLDQAKLTLVELKRGPDIHWLPHPQYPLKVRASADGSTFAAWQPGVSPGGIRVLTLQGDIAHSRYAHDSAGVLQPSYDGRFLFTETGIYSADLRPVAAEQFRGLTCFPCCHPAYFLAYSGENGFHNPTVPTEKPKLSLYATGDKRPLLSFTEFEELSDPSQSPFDGQGPLAIDKRIHFFPAANLLVTIPPARDRLVLRKLDLTAALEKAGIDYLYVASLPPATAERGGTLTYQIEVKSRRGGVRCTLDSGPEGLTLSDDGKLLWKVPSGEPSGQQGVIITIRDSSGQEIMHTFNIVVP